MAFKIPVCYHGNILEIRQQKNSDWIDLRAAETVDLRKGEYRRISLGISMKLPKGWEAIVVPRSSTFEMYGIIQTNSIGVIDNSYSGANDIWMFPALAMRDTHIIINNRICQFRIQRRQPGIEFYAYALNENGRGGFGSTGVI